MAPRRGAALLGLSMLLHGAVLAALLAPPVPGLPEAGLRPVALVWDSREEGARSDAATDGGPAPPDAPPAAAPPPDAAPQPPSVPAAPATPPRAPAEAAPAPAALPAPLPSAAAPMAAQESLPPPPPPAPPLPRREPPPPRAASAAQAMGALSLPPAGGPAGGPVAEGGLAIGAVVPPRPATGAANPSPEYPHRSRLRGEQGRVTLLVQVEPTGRVRDLEVIASSGHAALDEEAMRTVRRWRFDPATRSGQPVFAEVRVGITFRLEGERRW
ncbi:energy transducer TonB [Falsiroseomonas sp.]|uniref:energy transducer TonB n=1 Tax=Falsiroseomonas sp. TaxID=2870721 RepID=UPI0035624191